MSSDERRENQNDQKLEGSTSHDVSAEQRKIRLITGSRRAKQEKRVRLHTRRR